MSVYDPSRSHSPLIFVYGTLLDGDQPAAILLREQSAVVGQGRFPGSLFSLPGYPAAVYREGEGYVYGELRRLEHPESVWPVLDEYEGDEYVRRLLPVEVAGRNYRSWVYLYRFDPAQLPRIADGRWTSSR